MPKQPKSCTFALNTLEESSLDERRESSLDERRESSLDVLATLKCIKSDPPMPRDSQSLFDPRVTYSVWIYDCNCARCPDCVARRDEPRYGFEDLYSDSDSDGESCIMLFNPIAQEDESACYGCNRNTRSGFDFSLYGLELTRSCCDDSRCKSFVRKSIEAILPAMSIMEEVE